MEPASQALVFTAIFIVWNFINCVQDPEEGLMQRKRPVMLSKKKRNDNKLNGVEAEQEHNLRIMESYNALGWKGPLKGI